MNRGLGVSYSVLLVFIIIFLAWFTWLLLDYIPFYLPSYCIWGGIFIVMLGTFGILFPIQRIGLKTRKRAVLVVLAGLILVSVAFFWPPSTMISDGRNGRLDEFMPRYQCSEYHAEIARVPIERLEKAVLAINITDIPAADFLLRLRFLFSKLPYRPDTRPFLELTPDSEFMVLDDSNPKDRVYAMVGIPWEEKIAWEVRTAEQFSTFKKPGYIRIAFNFRIEDKGEKGVLISTETRSLGNDSQARKIFARYWRVIYPGSSIIRRVWLNAIIDNAKRNM
jgi:hypothetical protein